MDAGKIAFYSVDYSQSTCSNSSSNIYNWTATYGTVQAPTSGCGISPTYAAATKTSTQKVTPYVGSGGNECPNADITWNNVSTVTTATITVTDLCLDKATLNVILVPKYKCRD